MNPCPVAVGTLLQAVKQQQEKRQGGAVAAAVFTWVTGSASPGVGHHTTQQSLNVRAQRPFMP